MLSSQPLSPNESFMMTIPKGRVHSTDSVSLQLKKSKQESENAKAELQEVMKRIHKLEIVTNKHEKLSIMAKNKCMKLYEVKKSKMFAKTILEQSKTRKQFIKEQQFEQTQKKKMEEEIIKDMVRSQETYKRFQTRERIVKYKKGVQQDLQLVQNSMYESSKKIVEGVRREKSRLSQRKRLIEEMMIEKGRQNYLNKLKKQFRAIQEYKDKISDLGEEFREADVLSRAFAKYSRESSRRAGITNNMSFFLTDKRPEEDGREGKRSLAK